MKREPKEVTIKIEGDFAFNRKDGSLTDTFIRAYGIDLRGLLANSAFSKYFNDFIMLSLETLANCKEEDMLYNRARLKVARDILASLQLADYKLPKVENKFIHKRKTPKKTVADERNYEL